MNRLVSLSQRMLGMKQSGNRYSAKRVLLFAVLAFLVMTMALSSGQATMAAPTGGGGLEIAWSTVDGGGAMLSTAGTYSLSGTIGQPDAGLVTTTHYSLAGGFWYSLAQLFLPQITK